MDRLSAMKLGIETSNLGKTFTMKQVYSIRKVSGTDKSVYSEIAPIIMSKEGMKYFDNYPVTTSKEHIFFILTYDRQLCGFATIIPHKTIYSIRNIYVNNERNANVSFNNLMKAILDDFEQSKFNEAGAYVKNEDIQIFKEKGFKLIDQKKNWSFMQKTKKP